MSMKFKEAIAYGASKLQYDSLKERQRKTEKNSGRVFVWPGRVCLLSNGIGKESVFRDSSLRDRLGTVWTS